MATERATRQRTVYFYDDDLEWLEKEAKKDCRTTNNFLRMIIRAEREKRKDGK